MFRLTTILCLALCVMVMVQSASVQNTKKRDLESLLGLDSEESSLDETVLGEEQHRTNFGNLGTVISVIKTQFKEIITEIGLQSLQTVLYIFQQLKVKLLTKLGFYTLADIVNAVLDGVTSFLVDSPPELYASHVVTTTKPPKPYFNSYWPLYRQNE